MSKTLIVHYTPRGERSKTKHLVDAFRSAASGKTEIVERDLAVDPPEMLLKDNLMAYVMRQMVGEQKPEYDVLLAKFDELTDELMAADNVVIAFPVYNYSVPAVVKAWLDSVVQNNKTFEMSGPGQFEGLMKGNVVILSTAGGMGYEEGGPMHKMDFARPLMVEGMNFMGYSTVRIDADGANALAPDEYAKVLERADADIKALVAKWYS